MRRSITSIAAISLFMVVPSTCLALDTGVTGTPSMALEWNARVRYESVSDDAFADDAEALTGRVRLGLKATLGSGWRGLVEGEGVAAAIDHHNNGANGRTGLPPILDPTGAELNQAWLGWQGGMTAFTLGRQRLQLDNQRFLGNVGWRQNEQTFDALSLQLQATPGVSMRYAWLARVHRINGDEAIDPLARERRLDSHLVEFAAVRGPMQFGAYVLAHHDRDAAAASTLTTGVRWTGTRPGSAGTWGWRIEAARQVDHADNPRSFHHGYWLLEPSLKRGGTTWRAGWEHLGGNGTHALQTPLATLHAFNGWADKFLATPAAGLEDRYASAGGTFGSGALAKLAWVLAWHDFRAAMGGTRLGSEVDASLTYPIREKLVGQLKLADYRADAAGRDTRKLWLQLEWSR